MNGTVIPGHVLAVHNNPGPLRVLSSEEASLTKGLPLFSRLFPATSLSQTLLVRGIPQKEDRASQGRRLRLLAIWQGLSSFCGIYVPGCAGCKQSQQRSLPSQRGDKQARLQEHSELSAMLAGEKSMEGEKKWEGRRQRRRRVDRGPKKAVLGRMMEGWGLSREAQ